MRSMWKLGAALVLSVCCLATTHAEAEEKQSDEGKTVFEVFGFAMTDSGYNFGTINPDWYDVVRPSKLPAFDGEFGEDGRTFMGVRQSRLGVKSLAPTSAGDLKVHLEAELFGVGDDAGRTTFRLRHAFGELGQFGAGQTWSTFMDPDVFPNSIEYWGPNGMVFYRNVQIRWKRAFGPSEVQVSLENPGGSADTDNYADRIELANVSTRFPVPDAAAYYKLSGDLGHVKLAGIIRYLRWDDFGATDVDLSGDTVGWGINLSTNIKFGKFAVLKLQGVLGDAIQNYMNDAVDDIAVETRDDPGQPLVGVALRTLGTVAFLDINWSERFTSTIGHSFMRVYNSDGQSADDLKTGQYALANVLIHPTENFFLGPELQWGQRNNFGGDYTYDDVRIQFSMKYSFDHKVTLD